MISEELLNETIVTLSHARTFIKSREKMHPTGVELYEENLKKLICIQEMNKSPVISTFKCKKCRDTGYYWGGYMGMKKRKCECQKTKKS